MPTQGLTTAETDGERCALWDLCHSCRLFRDERPDVHEEYKRLRVRDLQLEGRVVTSLNVARERRGRRFLCVERYIKRSLSEPEPQAKNSKVGSNKLAGCCGVKHPVRVSARAVNRYDMVEVSVSSPV